MADYRAGRWVVYKPENRTGIYVREVKPGYGEVHLVNREGETTLSVVSPHMSLRKAKRGEIPLARRKTANRKILDRLYPE